MKHLQVEGLSAEAQYLRLLDYGEPGTGKTWFGATACLDPLTSPVLFVEYRAQIASLRSNPEFTEAIKDGRLVIVSLDEYKELNHVYTYLFKMTQYQKQLAELRAIHGGELAVPDLGPIGELFTEHGPPKTVVTDSTTELQRSEVMRRAENPVGKFLTDIEPPRIQHWGQLLNQFTLLAHLFYQLPMHVVFNGLEAVDYAPATDSKGNEQIGRPPRAVGYRLAMQGQAQRQFPAYALTVMQLERAARNIDAFNIGYTQGAASKTKEQTGMFPAKLYNPTIPMMVKMLQGGN